MPSQSLPSQSATPELASDIYDNESITSQDVIDAIRFGLMAQKEPAEALKLIDCLLEFAPETDTNRGVDLIVRLLAEGSLRVEIVGP